MNELRAPAFERVAAAAIVVAAGACMVTAFAGLNRATPSLATSIHVEPNDAVVRVVRNGVALETFPDLLQFGDSLTVESGRPVLHVPGGTVEFEPGAALEVQLPVKIDRARATARGTGLALDLNGVLAQVDGEVRIERGYTAQISVLSGSAIVHSAGRSLELGASSEVIVPGVGLLPSASQPIDTPSATIATAVLTSPVAGTDAAPRAPSAYPVPARGRFPASGDAGPTPAVANPAAPGATAGTPNPLAPPLSNGDDAPGVLDQLLGGVLGALLP